MVGVAYNQVLVDSFIGLVPVEKVLQLRGLPGLSIKLHHCRLFVGK